MSCRALLQLLNAHRAQNRLEAIDAAVFIRTVGGEAACAQTLQAGVQYAARPYDFNPCGGSTRCTLTRDMIKRGIAHALLGHFPNPAQNILYDSRDPTNLFPLHLRNYFADASHDDHRVTVDVHRLDERDLTPGAPFGRFSFRPGDVGEDEDVVPVVTIWDTFFSAAQLRDPRDSLRHRHLDLLAAAQVVRWDISPVAAVLVSGFQSTSTVFGEPMYFGKDRQMLFLDANWYVHNPFGQYDWVNVKHELVKAEAGFSAAPRGKAIESLWVAGANDAHLRLLIQLLAAAETGRELVFRLPQDAIRMPHELIAFLAQVSRYHPQAVLRVLQAFLPLLAQHQRHLSEPEVASAFLQRLAEAPPHQDAPALQSPSPSPVTMQAIPQGYPPPGAPSYYRPHAPSPPPVPSSSVSRAPLPPLAAPPPVPAVHRPSPVPAVHSPSPVPAVQPPAPNYLQNMMEGYPPPPAIPSAPKYQQKMAEGYPPPQAPLYWQRSAPPPQPAHVA